MAFLKIHGTFQPILGCFFFFSMDCWYISGSKNQYVVLGQLWAQKMLYFIIDRTFYSGSKGTFLNKISHDLIILRKNDEKP